MHKNTIKKKIILFFFLLQIYSILRKKKKLLTMTSRKIAFDISHEMAKRIVEEARELQKEEEKTNCLNMVIYKLIEEEVWLGIFHVWQTKEDKKNNKVFLRCVEDTYDSSYVWLFPIELTEKNMTRFFTRIHDEDCVLTHILLFYGSNKNIDAYIPCKSDGTREYLPHYHDGLERLIFCQEHDSYVEASELKQMVFDFFSFSH